MREDWDADGVRYEAGDDVVGSRRKGAIPISPIGRGCVRVVLVEDVAAQEVGYLLDEALQEESEFRVSVSYVGGHGVMHIYWMSTSWVFNFSRAKVGEPMGEPRRQKPLVSSAGSEGPRISMSFCWVEYWEMALEIEVVSAGLS